MDLQQQATIEGYILATIRKAVHFPRVDPKGESTPYGETENQVCAYSVAQMEASLRATGWSRTADRRKGVRVFEANPKDYLERVGMPTTYFTKHKTAREATAKTAKKLMMASPCNPITITLWEKVEEEEFYPAYVPAPMSKREVRALRVKREALVPGNMCIINHGYLQVARLCGYDGCDKPLVAEGKEGKPININVEYYETQAGAENMEPLEAITRKWQPALLCHYPELGKAWWKLSRRRKGVRQTSGFWSPVDGAAILTQFQFKDFAQGYIPTTQRDLIRKWVLNREGVKLRATRRISTNMWKVQFALQLQEK